MPAGERAPTSAALDRTAQQHPGTAQRHPGTAQRHPGTAPHVQAPPRPASDATDLTAEPEASDDRVAQRPRLVWRHLLVAGLVGALLGAGIPATVQGLERAAAAGEVDAVRALADDYMRAIVEGRAADATAMVPPGSAGDEVAPDAVLAAAAPIEGVKTWQVQVDGDAASVAISFRTGRGSTRILLDAERVDGAWRLVTSLAEPVSVFASQQGDVAMIAGTPLIDRLLLYPGGYTLDETSGPVLRTAGERFTVDGDPRTAVEIFPTMSLEPALATAAGEMAFRAAVECVAAPDCPLQSTDGLDANQGAYVLWHDGAAGTVQLVVPLTSGVRGPAVEMQVRMHYDAEGVPTRWECGRPGEYEGALTPCPALG